MEWSWSIFTPYSFYSILEEKMEFYIGDALSGDGLLKMNPKVSQAATTEGLVIRSGAS